MALISKKGLLERIRRGRKAREQLVASNLSEGIAFQIRATRDSQNLTQSALAELVGMTPNNVSRLENPEYGNFTLSSLRRIAAAFDVALVVRFIPFSQYIDWLSGTPHVDAGLSRRSIAPESFVAEESAGIFNQSKRAWEVTSGGVSKALAGIGTGIGAGGGRVYGVDSGEQSESARYAGAGLTEQRGQDTNFRLRKTPSNEVGLPSLPHQAR